MTHWLKVALHAILVSIVAHALIAFRDISFEAGQAVLADMGLELTLHHVAAAHE